MTANRWRRWGPVVIPLAALAAWFAYLWFVSGVLPSEEHYSGGRLKSQGAVKRVGFEGYHRHGFWTTWHPNGVKASEGEYREGREVGDWRYYDEVGALEREVDMDAAAGSGPGQSHVGPFAPHLETGPPIQELEK